MNPQTSSRSSPREPQTNAAPDAARENQREPTAELKPEQIAKALWTQREPGALPEPTALTEQIRKLTIREDVALNVSQENLKQIDTAVRKELPLPEVLSLERAEYNVWRDGGSTGLVLSYYDSRNGELLVIGSGFENNLSQSNDAEARKIKAGSFRMSAPEIANDWEYGRRVALHLLKLDPTRTEVKQDRILTPDTVTWKFTEKLSAREQEVTFNLETGAAEIRQSEAPIKSPPAPRAANTEFKAGLVKYLSTENFLGLSEFGAKDSKGAYVLSDAKAASTKEQLAKAFNIPSEYTLAVNTYDDGTAWKSIEGSRYLSGNITSENLPEPVHFIFFVGTGEFLLGTRETLRTAEPVSRAEVPAVLQKLQR